MVSRGGVLALVPARGGSKSIPRKNIRPLAGVPLLAYSIEAGLAARCVDRVVVSTDDVGIAAVARRYGAEVPFIRPSSLAGDTTPDLPVFAHALDWLREHDGWEPDIVVQLRPTSPFRPPGLVDAAVARLRSEPSIDCVRTVAPASQHPYKMWRLTDDTAMTPLIVDALDEVYNQPRQELPVVHWQTGHVDAIPTRTIREQGSVTGRRIAPLVVERAYVCDIDTEDDWMHAEALMQRSLAPMVRPRNRNARLPDVVKLVVFDFDGVLTDNRVWVGGDGAEWVACSRSDGLGIERLRRVGVHMLVLSSETHPVVGARCRKLGIPCEQGVADKAVRLRDLLAARGIAPAHVVYVGNDVNDVECLRLVGCGVVVADAQAEVIADADVVLSRPGGQGAVRELCDRLVDHLSPGGAR